MTARETFRIGGMALLAGAVLSFLTTLLNTFLLENGFKLEKGDPVNGTYGTGSSVGRAIAGGFAKRAKYDLSVASVEGGREDPERPKPSSR